MGGLALLAVLGLHAYGVNGHSASLRRRLCPNCRWPCDKANAPRTPTPPKEAVRETDNSGAARRAEGVVAELQPRAGWANAEKGRALVPPARVSQIVSAQ